MNYQPCNGCTKRYPGCQDVCPDGLEADRQRRERKKKITSARKLDTEATGAIIGMKETVKKRRR